MTMFKSDSQISVRDFIASYWYWTWWNQTTAGDVLIHRWRRII